MESLEELFQERALTYEQLSQAMAEAGLEESRLFAGTKEEAVSEEAFEKLQKEMQAQKESYEKAYEKLKLEHAVEMEIWKAKGRNPKAIRALIDMEQVYLENGQVKGLNLDQLKQSDGYLFDDTAKRIEGSGHEKGLGMSLGRRGLKAQFESALFQK